MRDTTFGEFTLYLHTGAIYEFSAPSATDRYARVESISDPSADGNAVTFEYNGAVGVGRLTKVNTPSGDPRYLQLSYSGNLITKVELKNAGGTLHQTQYFYNASYELTKVRDNASKDVTYAYGSYTYEDDEDEYTLGRYITCTTDKMGNETDFTWTWQENGYSSVALRIDTGKSKDRLPISKTPK